MVIRITCDFLNNNPVLKNIVSCEYFTLYNFLGFLQIIPLLVGSVIAVLPLNGGPGEVTLTQSSNPYLHLDVDSRNISIIKELDTDKDENGNKLMSDIILQVMCRPTGSTVSVSEKRNHHQSATHQNNEHLKVQIVRIQLPVNAIYMYLFGCSFEFEVNRKH